MHVVNYMEFYSGGHLFVAPCRYPYEAYRVTTEDGHVLLLERIPR
jgi:hypothetical protein